MTRTKSLDELLEQARAEGHPVVEVDASRAYTGALSPFIVVRDGSHAVVLNPLGFDDHLCVDAHPFIDGEPVTAGAFGMTDGRRVAFPDTGDTSHGWASASLVSVLVGRQGTTEQAVRDILTAAGCPRLADEGTGPDWRIVTPGWHVFTYQGKVRVDWWSDGTLSPDPADRADEGAALAALRPVLEAAGLTVTAPDSSVLEIGA